MVWLRQLTFIVSITLVIILFVRADNHSEQGLKNDYVTSLLRRQKHIFLSAAKQFDLPPIAVAGAIAAELTLNRGYVDYLQERWLERQLEKHGDEWWTAWALKEEQIATQARNSSFVSNKWPVSLTLSGYVVSFGPAQITPRTVLLACRKRGSSIKACQGSIREVISRLLLEEPSIWFTAVILHNEAEEWRAYSEYNAKRDPGLLVTLYSMGGEYYRYQFAKADEGKRYNGLGKWLVKNEARLSALLK